METLRKGASCLLFLGDTSIWCPAEVKGEFFCVSTLCDSGNAETPKRGLACSCHTATTTTATCGPTSLTATLERGSPKLKDFCFYFGLQRLHHSHTYTAPKVGGQPGQSCHRYSQPGPGARAGADMGLQGAWWEP